MCRQRVIAQPLQIADDPTRSGYYRGQARYSPGIDLSQGNEIMTNLAKAYAKQKEAAKGEIGSFLGGTTMPVIGGATLPPGTGALPLSGNRLPSSDAPFYTTNIKKMIAKHDANWGQKPVRGMPLNTPLAIMPSFEANQYVPHEINGFGSRPGNHEIYQK